MRTHAFERPIDFDIPAQPLELALNAYGAATQIQLMVDAELIAGLRSSALKGTFAPETALGILLGGTGLAPRAIGDQGFTLVSPSSTRPAPDDRSRALVQVSPTVVRFNDYSAAIQGAVRGALCQSAETSPGSYRALIRFWVDASGMVARTELLTSTGDKARDAKLSAAVQGLPIGAVPPVGLPQPVTLLFTADGRSSGYCSGGAARRRAEADRGLAR